MSWTASRRWFDSRLTADDTCTELIAPNMTGSFATRLFQISFALAAPVCAGLHVAGLVAMALILRHGMLTQPDVGARASFIAENPGTWTLGWILWMLCGLSLVAFYAWWGSRVAAARIATIAVLIAAAGSVFDLSGESVSSLILVESAMPILSDAATWDPAGFLSNERLATVLTAGIANLLYTLAGVLLMACTRELPGRVRLTMSLTWLAGFGMSLAAFMNHVPGMVVATAVLFPTLIVWTWWMGRHWRTH